MKSLLLLPLLAFATPAATPKIQQDRPVSLLPGPDGYIFEGTERVTTDLRIKVILVQSQEEMRKIAPQVRPGLTVRAFTLSNPNGDCILVKIDSRIDYRPEVDGHELNHCIYGNFHKIQSREYGA